MEAAMLGRVLVVDDSVIVQEVLRKFFQGFRGCSVICASNGVEGLERLHETGRSDLIVLDIMMPEMDGLEFLEKLRKCPLYSNHKIIVATSIDSLTVRAAAMNLGADAYLMKPLVGSELLSVIDSLFVRRLAA